MNRSDRLARHVLLALIAVLTTGAAQCQGVSAERVRQVEFAAPPVSRTEQDSVMLAAARTAWRYVVKHYSDSSGLVRPVDNWDFLATWDIASALGAYHSARGLGLIAEPEYRRRVDRALRTLERAPFYEGVAFNKLYDSRSGRMTAPLGTPSERGYGWSALDLGRFLVWMKILHENDPVARPAVERIVRRLRLDRIVKEGYLVGATFDTIAGAHKEYREGKIAYEQYAAAGYAAWGRRAEHALGFATNGKPVSVLGQRILADKRGGENVTSEPYVMMGLELGWSDEWRAEARSLLAAQRERTRRTGVVTMVSEDAVPVEPWYFYYYNVYRNGTDFGVRAHGGEADPAHPRWVSSKAAFAWHALLPSDFTWRAIQTVRPAAADDGWGTGVREGSGEPFNHFSLNTAAVILEAAYYWTRGCPLVRPTCD